MMYLRREQQSQQRQTASSHLLVQQHAAPCYWPLQRQQTDQRPHPMHQTCDLAVQTHTHSCTSRTHTSETTSEPNAT